MQSLVAALAVLVSFSGCGGGTQTRAKTPAQAKAAPAPDPAKEAPTPPAPAPAPTAAEAPPAPAATTEAALQALTELPDQVEAGDINRGTLVAVLAGGVGQFLQRLRAEPQLDKGRFLGWRVVSFAEGDATLRSGVLRPGDTVLRVNGQSIERPEQFKNVWDSMATSSDLVFSVQRAGKKSEVRYRIID